MTALPDSCLAVERLMTTPDAGEVLGLSSRTLEDLRWKGEGPRYLRLSRNCIRYRHADLIAWAEERARFNTTHGPPMYSRTTVSAADSTASP